MRQEKKNAVGIDLGGTFIKYAIIDADGGFILDGKLPTCAQEGPEKVTEQILEAVRLCKAYMAEKGLSLAGVGIGTPGIISADGRTVLGGAENIPGWENIPLADFIEKNENLPTLVNNDANVMALAETLFGAAKGYTDVVFLTIGTGIGGGILIGEKLYGGYKNRGTELGHITIKYDGEPCPCGSVGCLETYASTAALVRRYANQCKAANVPLMAADGEKLVERYHAKEPCAVEAMHEHWNFLGIGIAGIINIFSPQMIVIGGGISEAGDFYLDGIRKNVEKYVMRETSAETGFATALLGNKSGCLGAAGLIFM